MTPTKTSLSVVSKPLPDRGPVFLFYMGVIILMIGSASDKLDGVIPLSEVFHQVPVEEFGAVIAVKAEQGEGEGVFDLLDLSEDFGFAFTPDGSLFGPSSGDIDRIYGIDKLSEEAFSAVGDGIGFQESGSGLIPLVGLDGDLFSQEGAGFGGRSSSTSVFHTGRF